MHPMPPDDPGCPRSLRLPGRLDRGDITLFKSVGAAIEDLAAASLLVTAANPGS